MSVLGYYDNEKKEDIPKLVKKVFNGEYDLN